MPALNRTVNGLLLREDFSTANGWTAGTGFSRVAQKSLVTWGKLPTAILAPGASGQPDEQGVREGQLYIEGSTWTLMYDAGNGTTGWRQFVATSADRGLTWSRAAQSIQLDNGSGGSWAATATGWFAKIGATYYWYRIPVGAAVSSGPNKGLPLSDFEWDIWHCATINGTYTFDRLIAPGAQSWCTTDCLPGSQILASGTYYHFLEGSTGVGDWKIGYATAAAPGGPYSIQAGTLITTTNFGFGRAPENPKVFYHQQLAQWVMLLNLIAADGTHTDRNGISFSSSLTDWSSSLSILTQRVGSALDTNVGAVGVQTHVTAPDGSVVNEAGFIPMVYDADPQGVTPGWHLGRTIFGAVLEPSPACLSYSDLTATRHTYSRSLANADFVAEFEVDFLAQRTPSDISFEYRVTGSVGYRLVVSNSVGNTGLILTLLDNTIIASSMLSSTVVGVFLRIKIVVAGSLHKAYLDGLEEISVTDTTYASGTDIAFSGLNCVAGVRLLSIYTSPTLTIRGLVPSTPIYLRTFGALPVAQVTPNSSGVATYAGTHYPISRVEYTPGVDAQTPDLMLWGGDDVTVYQQASNGGIRL